VHEFCNVKTHLDLQEVHCAGETVDAGVTADAEETADAGWKYMQQIGILFSVFVLQCLTRGNELAPAATKTRANSKIRKTKSRRSLQQMVSIGKLRFGARGSCAFNL
jgi:hypothetical protein